MCCKREIKRGERAEGYATQRDGGRRMTLLQEGSVAAFFADGLFGLRDDERSGKTESQRRFLSILIQSKERELKRQPRREERKSGEEKVSI